MVYTSIKGSVGNCVKSKVSRFMKEHRRSEDLFERMGIKLTEQTTNDSLLAQSSFLSKALEEKIIHKLQDFFCTKFGSLVSVGDGDGKFTVDICYSLFERQTGDRSSQIPSSTKDKVDELRSLLSETRLAFEERETEVSQSSHNYLSGKSKRKVGSEQLRASKQAQEILERVFLVRFTLPLDQADILRKIA